MNEAPRVSVIIPALDEALALPGVIAAVPPGIAEVIVVDNGSTDGTGEVARAAGARVVREPRRGYGAACLAGVMAARDPDVLVFMDGDHSDDPTGIPQLLAPIVRGEADLVIGSRVLGQRERGALLPQARAGNALAALLIRLLFGARITDLGPFRAIRVTAWRSLQIDDAGFGITTQTQVRALVRGLRVVEVPVSYRRRIGRSKISGTVLGTWRAGWGILSTIAREYAARPARHG